MKSPKIGICVALFLFAIPVLPSVATQPNDSTDEKYAQVLDLVFGTEWCDPPLEGGQLPDIFSREQITVRVLPSFWHESQIVVCTWAGGKTLLVHSTLGASDHMVWTPVIEESMGGRKPTSAEDMAAAFHPVHQVCDADPAVIGDWFKQLRSMRFDVPNGGGLDGITYEIKLYRGMNEIRAKVWGPDEKASLISWVEKVQRAIGKMSCKETQYRHR